MTTNPLLQRQFPATFGVNDQPLNPFKFFLILVLLTCGSHLRAETVVWQDNFDDGNGDNRWFSDFGVWQIGSPTVGPRTNAAGSRTFSGSHCATTGLNGNYPSSQDSRLIRIASFTVPNANQNPRLRFWHWYSFAGPAYLGLGVYDEGSYGSVEIKVGAGNWQPVSPTYVRSSSAIWSRPSIDLAPFAGRSVQIAFHFHSAANRDAGWYVDDVAVVTDAPVLNNPDGFESGLSDWSVESGTWEVGVPTSGPGDRAHGGTNCAATVLAGNYASSVDSRLISPSFTVPASNSYPRLRFWHWYSIAGPAYLGLGVYDEGSYGYVEIKVGTNAWQEISPGRYTSSGSAVWSQPSIDLTAYAGQTNVQIAFHFHSAANVAVGWYVDDVALVTGVPVFNNPDGFESGLGDWSVESGTWQVGVPTSGPGSAHGGTNCAATVLAGNYASSVDSRLISSDFVVPPPATSPSVRFWHWFSFAGPAYLGLGVYDEGSYGYVEIKVGTNDWLQISPKYTGNGGAWTQPFLDLRPYGGKRVRLAFHFHSANNVSSGWYVDDVRLVHDFATLLLDSPIVRAQDNFCVSLGIAASSPASTVNFTLQAPAGNLTNVTLSGESCWTNATITPQPNSEWLVTLHNGCTTAPMGVRTIGSLCFTAISPQSAFVPFTINNLVVTNLDASTPVADAFGNRAVVIANESLLEATVTTNSQRMLTVFGKPDTRYEIQRVDDLGGVPAWSPGWTNTVPSGMSYSFFLEGGSSNAPIVFLRATEK